MGYRSLRALLVLALVLCCFLALGGIALAQETPPGEVIIDGLNGPMGVLVGDDGAVYVADSGLGGDQAFTATMGAAGVLDVTAGPSAQVVKYDPADGTTTVLAQINSYGSPLAEFSGGTRLAMLDGELYVGVADWLQENDPPADPPLPLATINRINADGTTDIIFDSWAFERDSNPYGLVYHGHPFDLVPTEEGTLLVAEAGGNVILEVDPATGEATVVATMDPLPGVFPRPEYDNEFLTDPVPTAIVLQDGTIYASLLSGAPFVPGNARVVTVNEDGTASDYATGLTMLIDLAEGPDGVLYAVTFAVFGEQGPVPNSGAILRIAEGDASEVVLDGLTFPSSIDFDADGTAYISLGGLGAPGSGQVIAVDGLAEAEGTPYSEILAAMAPPVDATAPVTGTAEVTATTEVTTSAEATAVATEEPAEEATAVATEEPTEEATAVATEEPTEEATAVATEEPTEEATAVATEEPAEEVTVVAAEVSTTVATEEATEEATAAPAEEATEAPAEEATAAPVEEATPAPSEEAPEMLPQTGADSPTMAFVAAAVLAILALGAVTFATRKRQ